MKNSITNLKLSTIQDHNADKSTDRLYDPLRNIIMHPESVTCHELQSPRAATKSIIQDRYQKLTSNQTNQLRKDLYIPVQHQLIPSEDLSRVEQTHYRIIDAQQKVIGPLLTRSQVQLAIKNKKDSTIVYELGDKVNNLETVSLQLKYNRSNSNLKSQIILDESKVISRSASISKGLGRHQSQAILSQPLPTYEQIQRWLSFRERQSLRKMKESQVNPEAKGYIYEYNITQRGTQVKTKMNRHSSLGSIKGSTIIEAVAIPVKRSMEDSSPSSPLAKHSKIISNSFIANPEVQMIQREYYNNAPLPMAYQSQRVITQESRLANRGQISVDEKFDSPKKLRTEPELKELSTTAMKSFDQDKCQNMNYTYKVQQINDSKNVGCGGFCNGE